MTRESHDRLCARLRSAPGTRERDIQGLPSDDMPVVCLTNDGYWVIVGDFGDDTAGALERLAKYKRVAASLRAQRPIAEQDDVAVYLAAPSDEEPWRAVAARAERDDLVCRKLVWLQPLSSEELETSLERFIERTFLARPWAGEAGALTPELDVLTHTECRVADRLGAPRAAGWFTVLLSGTPDESPTDLATRLIADLGEVDP